MILILALLVQFSGAQVADLLVENAVVYTGNRVVTRIAAAGGKVISDVRRGPNTVVIDAHGATIVPGFIDSHAHMSGLGELLQQLDFRGAKSPAEVIAAVARAAKERPRGTWIRGRAWDQTRWPGAQFPDAAELSRAVPEHPVYLTRVDGHAAWVNRKALEIADLNAATKDPPGGRIHRDPQGVPSGILIDRAMALVSRKIPAPSDEDLRNRLRRAAAECVRWGITSVHDAGVGAREIAAYRELKLPVRIYAMIGGAGALWEEWLRRGPEIGDFLTVRSVKLMADGALGSRGAALKQPYSDEPSNTGLLILNREQIESVAGQAVAHGFQANTHAIGDRANRVVLDAYASVLKGPNDKRFRIEHAQIVSLEDIPLFQRFSVIASIQSTHATSDMRWAAERVGPKRILGAYAWQRFLTAGVRIANGSDFPVEQVNPLLGFYAAITRMDETGMPAGGWFPDQRLSRDEALRSWTSSAAYAAFEEKSKGTLEPGMLADFVMLSKDIMRVPASEILNTTVRMTVIGGRIVYQAN